MHSDCPSFSDGEIGNLSESHILSSDLKTEMAIIHAMEARHAAQHGDFASMKRLLDAGLITPDAVDSDDCSLLHWASINNRIDIARLLIDRKCNVNAVGGVLASTPLHWASRHGLTQMVALLVHNGANWNLKDVEGFTPLHIAVQFGCTPVAAFFIAAGQSPDVSDDTQMTPAMWAAYKVYGVFPLKMLSVMGADLERRDATYGNTALHWAVTQGNHNAVNTLLRLNVELEPVNKEKETPLDVARRKNDLLTIRLIELALRERGIIPSTWRQRLYEDKKLSKHVLFIIPFFTTFCAAFIFDSSMDYLSKAELLILLSIFSTFTIRHFIREHRDIAIQHLLMGVAFACKFFLIVGWIVFLHPIVPFSMQVIFLMLTVAVPFVFYRICDSDPGFIQATHKERCQVIVEMTGDEKFNENFCSNCLILKPHGSRHCRLCGHCVRQHDHHCPWLSTCVGASNHRLFVAYLLLLNFSTLLTFIGCIYYWQEMCGPITRRNLIFCRPWVLIMHWMSCTFFIWTFMMSCIQCYELLAQYVSNNFASHRCGQFNFGGNKLNMRSPFSRRCRLMRRICALGCAPTSLDADYEGETAFGGDVPSSVISMAMSGNAKSTSLNIDAPRETSRLL